MTPSWLDHLGGFGWRESVLLLALLLALYVLLIFLRLRRIGRPAPVDVSLVPPAMPVAPTLPEIEAAPAPPASPPAPAETPPEPDELPWVRTPEQRDERRRLEVIESEIVSMRSQIEMLSDTVAMLVDELRQAGEVRHEAPQAQGYAEVYAPPELRPVQPGSPLYGDAMQLALAGLDAASIAERCGIARAEAELVVALAQQAADKVNDRGLEGGGDGGQGRY